MTMTGHVDPKTGNVPHVLGGDYLLHFEGTRDDATFLVRVARSTTGPLLPFADLEGLLRYLDDMRELAPAVSLDGVPEWLSTRLAEPVRG